MNLQERKDAEHRLDTSSRCLYDATDKWRVTSFVNPPPAKDWTIAAARGVIAAAIAEVSNTPLTA